MNNSSPEIKEKKKFNLIPERLSCIETMTKGKVVDCILDNKNSSETNDLKSEDVRELLPKKYIDFGKAIKELGGKLLYIKSGSTGHTFKGVHKDQTKPSYAVKVVAYPKKDAYGDLYNSKRPENAELLMIKILSSFVINKQTPHIVLPITTFNTSIKPFLGLTEKDEKGEVIVEDKKFEQFIKRYKKGEFYHNVSVLVSEWATGGDLLDYLRKNYKNLKLKHWRTIFFQFLSVLAVIQTKYPSFRHNDLKANNVLVQLVDVNKDKYEYKINGQTYVVPNIGLQIKLWDYDFACIPGIVDNSKVEADWTTKINIKPEQNRYYDVHYFFNTLVRKGFFHEFMTEPEIPEKVREFVKRIVPEKYREGKYVSDKGRLLVNDEYLTPDEIIRNDRFFKLMRV